MRTLLAVALAAALSGLAACGKKAENPPPVAESAPVVEQGPTQDQKVDAMLRGHPNSRRVCVDGERPNAFFLDYGPIPPAGTPPDDKHHGILFIEKVEFYKTSNNSWFITNQADDRYIPVYPDLSGLVCKVQG